MRLLVPALSALLLVSAPLFAQDQSQPAPSTAPEPSDPQNAYDLAKLALAAESFTVALKLFTFAATNEHHMAQYQLGLMYQYGQGTPKDDTQAAHWLLKAAENGVAEAQSNIALRYELGQGVPISADKALHWAQKAAEQGNRYAQYDLGRYYYSGYATARNEEQALYWNTLAAQAGLPEAQYAQARFYQGISPAQPRDDAQVMHWMLLSAEQNYQKALEDLGLIYYRGTHTAKDDAESFRWFRKAAEIGSAVGEYNTGTFLQFGMGGQPKDIDAALPWLHKAAKQNYTLAFLSLGDIYFNHLNDYPTGAEYYIEAAKRHQPRGQYITGQLFITGNSNHRTTFGLGSGCLWPPPMAKQEPKAF
jgi:uncharacterized protein